MDSPAIAGQDRLACLEGLEGRALIEAMRAAFADRLAVVSSFGAEAAVLLHMSAQVEKSIPVIFLDTGKHFWQTRHYRMTLVELLDLTDVRVIRPNGQLIALNDPSGSLSAHNPDACCRLRKVAPLEEALQGFDGVLSGRKRYHGSDRAALAGASVDRAGRIKAEPLAGFTAHDVSAYFARYGLPQHPLVKHGFRSIGCMDCTTRGGSDDEPRAARWAGSGKLECGIHLGGADQLQRTLEHGV